MKKIYLQNFLPILALHLIDEVFASYNIEDISGSQMWSKVMVDEDYLQNDEYLEYSQVNVKILCGTLCAKKSFCNIWCYDEFETCSLSSTVVSPNYVETSPYSVMCFTKKRRDLVVGSIISTEDDYIETRELTADGIFLKGYGDTFITKVVQDPWIEYDLEKTAIIYGVTISENMPNRSCKEVEIHIGYSTSDLETLENTRDPCEKKDVMRFTPTKPMKGQFVVIIRKAESTKLMINYVEIDGVFGE